MNNDIESKELSSPEGTRGQFNGRTGAIKLGIDLHQAFCVVVVQEGGTLPKPAQRIARGAFLSWATKLRRQHPETPIHAVYEACGFGFGLQRELSALGMHCHVVCPQKLDERNQRVKTDGRDAKALCQKLDRYVEGNKDALAVVRVPTPEEEQRRAVHRQREQLVRTRKQLEAHGRSLMVNHGFDPISKWWKARTFAKLEVPAWLKELLSHTQPTYKPVVKWRKILAKGALATGAARKKAIVAVARQLAVDLWRLRTGQLQPADLGLVC